MKYFCTLFDSYYLNRGLVMHASLLKSCSDFHLYIFAFNDLSYDILTKLKLDKVTVISLREFESEELLRVKPGRTIAEYCWTSTPATVQYCLEKYQLPHCTYIDADLCFYHDPGVLISEMGDASVLITEHRYTPAYDQSALSGIYCVQFVTFKNNADGLNVLHWWAERCIEWCFNRHEDGKFGDQKYLDDWTTRFKGVHVLQHHGGGLAPWNIQQYKLIPNDNLWKVEQKSSGRKWDVVFYHFHHVTFYNNDTVDISCVYFLKDERVREFYHEYLRKILEINERLRKEFKFDAPVQKIKERSLLENMRELMLVQYRKVFKNYNIFPLSEVHLK